MEQQQTWESRCLRCMVSLPLHDGVTGCASCAAVGVSMTLVPFRTGTSALARDGRPVTGLGAMWRWARHLVPGGQPVSLGEGGTPLFLLNLPGSQGRVLVKDERANPTGSFKDRLASAAVSRARHVGADTVVVASTGNAGLAVAAYAAAGGLRCVLLATDDLPGSMRAAVHATGARVLLTDSFADRWTAARTGVEQLGCFPITNYTSPPVASHPAGVAAYRTIAFEIAEALDWEVPDWLVLPVSRGDGLFGIWCGFSELADLGWTNRVPRMLAVERHPSLSQALARGLVQPEMQPIREDVRARSISDPQGTAIALHALRASGGAATSVDDAQLEHGWRRLAARGVLLELSSAAVMCGMDVLTERGLTGPDSTTVLLATAGAFAQQTLTEQIPAQRVDDPADPDALATAADRAGRW